MHCFDMLCNLGKLLKNTFTSHSSTAKACSNWRMSLILFGGGGGGAQYSLPEQAD